MYYYGMRIEGLGTQNDNKFLVNGKELTDDFGLNWYEYGWCTYDAQLGRWHQVDPMDEFHSPYWMKPFKPLGEKLQQLDNPDVNYSESVQAENMVFQVLMYMS